MACSHCGQTGHNIQSCSSVRRCGHCNGRNHDRRNCPELRAVAPAPTTVGPCSIKELLRHCHDGPEAPLVHLYWPDDEHKKYFYDRLDEYTNGSGWSWKATPGHGVMWREAHEDEGMKPDRPTINFLVANENFADFYEMAARSRGLTRGVLVTRAAVASASNRTGCEVADVKVGHPNRHGGAARSDYWKFDIPNRRFGALAELRSASVIRLATPQAHNLRYITVPHNAVMAWWDL